MSRQTSGAALNKDVIGVRPARACPAQRRCAKKNGAQAIGRSRGGPSTKIHALADALGNPCALMLTAGQDHDLACAEPLLENTNPGAVIADKAYDADAFIDKLTKQGTTPVIPPKANRKDQRECDFALYCERNLIERFFNKIKHFRGIATRQRSPATAASSFNSVVSGAKVT